MQRRSVPATIPALLVVLILVAGCSTAETPSTGPAGTVLAETASPETSPRAPAAEPSPDLLLVDSIDALSGAVVQIETTGTFRDPFEGREDVTGRGSGFIVDPAGIIVTNNHVVTGAEKVTVWVGADRSEHEAQVLGASECSDLAVVRIDGGPFPYLEWYQGDIRPGLDIYAAGYPLGDPEYTLYRGIVSRAQGVIDEDWASVTNSIEHDANINPGSSGGPVVTDDGKVVAVDYAAVGETRQAFAISREEALPILSALIGGDDVTSIGINGVAIGPDEPVHQGIWVSSVKPGSPAAEAGILPGDSMTKLDGKVLSPAGTMKEYCEILRAHDAGEEVAFTVYREDSRETLKGVLNGAALKPGFAFATALGDGPLPDPTSLDFDEAADDPGQLGFETPSAWSDVLEQPWSFGGIEVGPGRLVASDVKAFKGGWRTPGVFVAASSSIGETVTVDGLLDAERSRFERSCASVARDTFKRGAYRGSYDLWQSCGGTDTKFLTIAATPKDGSHMVYLQFQAGTPADLAVLDRVLATLEVKLGGS